MDFVYNSVKIHYQIIGEGDGIPILLLHGWGANCDIFDNIIEKFPNKKFIKVDFPPFGRSGKNIEEWNIFTYVNMIMSLCDFLEIEKCDVFGHSFGGRIAIILSVVKRSLVHSCILVDSAGIKPKRKINYYIKVYKYKIYKKLGKDVSKFGSKDYQELSPNLKRTFKSIVETYLDEYAKKISVKTLIIWGKNDQETPLYMAKRLNKKIKHSTLKIIDNAGHFPFLDCQFEFCRCLNNFLEDL